MNLKRKLNLLEKLKEEQDTNEQKLRFGVKPKYIPKPITRWGIKIKKQNKVIKDKKHENT